MKNISRDNIEDIVNTSLKAITDSTLESFCVGYNYAIENWIKKHGDNITDNEVIGRIMFAAIATVQANTAKMLIGVLNELLCE